MAYLIFTGAYDDVIGQRNLSGPLVVGRLTDCDVVINHRDVSRHHCRIEPIGDKWYVSDLGSHNGTVVNGRKIVTEELHDGQIVQVGHFKLQFHENHHAMAGHPPMPHHTRPSTPVPHHHLEETQTMTAVGHTPVEKPVAPAASTTSHPHPTGRPARAPQPVHALRPTVPVAENAGVRTSSVTTGPRPAARPAPQPSPVRPLAPRPAAAAMKAKEDEFVEALMEAASSGALIATWEQISAELASEQNVVSTSKTGKR